MLGWSRNGCCDDGEHGRGDEDELEKDLHGDIKNLCRGVSTFDVVDVVDATYKGGTGPVEVEELKSWKGDLKRYGTW